MSRQKQESFSAEGPFRLGAWLVEPRLNRLTRDNESLQIELKMMDVLVCLAGHAGELVERQTLIDTVWATDFISENILTRAVAELRGALGDDAKQPEYIETIHRRGYRLIAHVEPVTDLTGESHRAVTAIDNLTVNDAGLTQQENEKPRRWPVIFAVVIAAAIAILVILPPQSLYDRLTGTLDNPSLRSIAVLPLVNISGEPGKEIFADGMTDALITELATFGGFDRVISRTSVMQLKGTELSMPEIAEVLGVDGVLEGTVQPEDSRIRISVHLIHAPSDRHVWSGHYDREYSQILTLQSEVAAAVAHRVMVSVAPPDNQIVEPGRQVIKEAYEAFLLGEHYFYEGQTYENYSKSLDYFRRALEIDPLHAPSHLGVAKSLRYIAYRYRPSNEVMPEAHAAALKALELDPTSADAHTTLARIMTIWLWHWAGAEAACRRALELSPNSAFAQHVYAALLSNLGRFDEAIAAIDRALDLNPLSKGLRWRRGFILSLARRYEDALENDLETVELYPRSMRSHQRLAWRYSENGLHDEAIATLERAKELHSNPKEDPFMLLAQVDVYALATRHEDADGALKQLLELNETHGVAPGVLALAFAAVGDTENAIDWLETAYNERDTQVALTKVEPLFDPLRSDPRFQDILRRMDFPEN